MGIGLGAKGCAVKPVNEPAKWPLSMAFANERYTADCKSGGPKLYCWPSKGASMPRHAASFVCVLLAAAVLTACASKPPTRSELPRHWLTEAELVGRTLYQSKVPAWELALSQGGRAVLKRFSTGEEIADATWSIDDGDLIVQWKKRTRLRLFGPGAKSDYEYINAMYPGRVYDLQIR